MIFWVVKKTYVTEDYTSLFINFRFVVVVDFES